MGTKRNISTNYRDKKLLFKPLKEQQRRTLMMLLNPDGSKLRCENYQKINVLRTEIFETVMGEGFGIFNGFFMKKLFHIRFII